MAEIEGVWHTLRVFVIREFLEPLEALADPVSRGLHLIPFLRGYAQFFCRDLFHLSPSVESFSRQVEGR